MDLYVLGLDPSFNESHTHTHTFSRSACLALWRLAHVFAHISATINVIYTNLGALESLFKDASVEKNFSQNKGATAEILQVKVGSAGWSPRESGGKKVCVCVVCLFVCNSIILHECLYKREKYPTDTARKVDPFPPRGDVRSQTECSKRKQKRNVQKSKRGMSKIGANSPRQWNSNTEKHEKSKNSIVG